MPRAMRPDWMRDAAADLAGIAAELGTQRRDACRRLGRPQSAPSPRRSSAPGRPQQLQPSLDAMSFTMDDALYARISALSPAPPPATDRLEEA